MNSRLFRKRFRRFGRLAATGWSALHSVLHPEHASRAPRHACVSFLWESGGARYRADNWDLRGPQRCRDGSDKDASLSDPLLLNYQDPLKRQAQIQLPFEKPRYSFDADKVQPDSVAHFNVDADVAGSALDHEFGDGLPVIAFEALGHAQHSGQEPGFLSL